MILIRERPPMTLTVDVETPDTGLHYRWAGDAHNPANVPSGLQMSSTMPGGFESLSCTLPRKTDVDYNDLEEFATITAYGLGGDVAGQARLTTQPRTSGDQFSISPAAIGWQAHLDDIQVRPLYIDMDLSHWTNMPDERVGTLNTFYRFEDAVLILDGPGVDPTTGSGKPAWQTSVKGPVAAEVISEAWYNSFGIPIGGLFYGWYRDPLVVTSETRWAWSATIKDGVNTDAAGQFDWTGVFGGAGTRPAGPVSGFLPATTDTRYRADVSFQWSGSSPALTENTLYILDWTVLSIVGRHGLPLYGGDWQTQPTLLASDIVEHAVSTYCPAFTSVNVEHGGYFIAQSAYIDAAVPVSQIVRDCGQFLLEDWAVWEGPAFWWTARGERGRSWRARIGPSQLQETGPDATQLFNQVVVSYIDVDNTTRTVGPPGVSYVDWVDDSLFDSSESNPVTAAGLVRTTSLSLNTATPAEAIKVGQTFLELQRTANHAGSATLTGYVEDDRATLWPAWKVRAGDSIVFTDAADTSPRRIVSASYDHDSRTCSVALDSPPDQLAAILQRFSAGIATTGFT